MKKLLYTPDAIEDLKDIKQYLRTRFDSNVAKENFEKIQKGIKRLKNYPDIGVPTKDKWNIDSEYKVVYIHHNYVFYTVKQDTINIINVIDEREDVLWKMFKLR